LLDEGRREGRKRGRKPQAQLQKSGIDIRSDGEQGEAKDGLIGRQKPRHRAESFMVARGGELDEFLAFITEAIRWERTERII
jgi:hypothetical protein